MIPVVCCRLAPDQPGFPIRVILTNESGYYLEISLYKEVTDIRSGQVRLLDNY